MNDLPGDGSVDDTALFEAITSGQPEAVVEAAAEPVKETPAAAEPAKTVDHASDAMVPSSRLREESERARNAERERDEFRRQLEQRHQVAQPAQPAQPVAKRDWWENPDSAIEERIGEAVTPLQKALTQQKLDFSRTFAVDKFGEDLVQQADAALGELARVDRAAAVEVANRMTRSAHPFGELVNWHKQQTALKEVGSDPSAYREKVKGELLKDPEFRKAMLDAIKAEAQPAPANDPGNRSPASFPSLNRIGSAATASAAGEPSDAELFAATTRRRK